MMMKQQIEKDFGKKYIDWLKQNIRLMTIFIV